jgi:hypothetical protein
MDQGGLMRLSRIVILLALISVGCSVLPGQGAPSSAGELPDLGLAPELENEVWINTDQPLRLADLQGRVVLLDMWTYG